MNLDTNYISRAWDSIEAYLVSLGYSVKDIHGMIIFMFLFAVIHLSLKTLWGGR